MTIDPIALVKGLGSHGATAAVPLVAMYALFTPSDQFNRHVAEASRPFIFDTVERAQEAEPGSDYHRSLCRTLEQSIASLCADAPDDAICLDREIHLERAGCR
jgi:hypothetical protein